jgi:hypothetical protein
MKICLPSSICTFAILGLAVLSLSSCSDPKVPQLQDELTKSKEDQARTEGQLAQIKADNTTATTNFQNTIAAQKAQIESLQQQLKDISASLTALQAQIANNQIQQTNQKKADSLQDSYGKAIEVLKGIRSRIAVGMNKPDYLALIREANASISSDLEPQGVDVSQFTFPKDWPATLNTDIGGSILISLQAYKDVMVLDAASAPDKFLPPPDDETQYVFKTDLREMMDRWDLPALLKGKFKLYDVPMQDQSIGFFSKKTIETYDISELHTLKQTGALVMWTNGGDAVRQMLFAIASKATDASSLLLNKALQAPPTGATVNPPPAPSQK